MTLRMLTLALVTLWLSVCSTATTYQVMDCPAGLTVQEYAKRTGGE